MVGTFQLRVVQCAWALITQCPVSAACGFSYISAALAPNITVTSLPQGLILVAEVGWGEVGRDGTVPGQLLWEWDGALIRCMAYHVEGHPSALPPIGGLQ